MNDSKRAVFDSRILVAFAAAALAAAHLFVPAFKVDQVALALIFLAMLPWLIPFLQAHVKRGTIFGQEIEFLEQELEAQSDQLREAKAEVDQTQDKINTIVCNSLAFYLFEHLVKLHDQVEFRYHKNTAIDKDLRLLRDLGYLEFFRVGDLQDGENLSGRIRLTPLGKLIVELRRRQE